METKNIQLKNAIWQILAAFLAHSISIQPGINMAYSTILLPQIMKSDGNISSVTESNLTNSTHPKHLIVGKDQASWIASLVTIATPLGSLIIGPLMDRFGRQKMCAFTMIPLIISWILVATTTDSVYTIYVARVLAGIGGGMSTVVLVYVSEISHPSIRPMLLSLTSVFVSFGILLTTLLSYFLDWKVVAICCGTIATASLVSILFLPESPSWLVGMRTTQKDPGKGLRKAERNLKWLYKNTKDYRQEFESLLRIKDEKNASMNESPLVGKETVEKWTTLSSPEAWKPILILFVLFTLQQFSGAYVVIFYAIQIFEKTGSVEYDKTTSLVILGFVRFVMAIISMFLSRKVGRIPLLTTSGLGMAVVILVAAGYIHFVGQGMIPVACLLLFVLFASYGLTVIPWTLIGELLPLSIRGKGSGILVAVAYLYMFLTVKLFIMILDDIGIAGVFIGFSVFSVVFVIFVYFAVPETLGRTFEEIESHFK
ncbi:hypothetical protein RUM43_012449 [Polyplax serrata]|uniref:Major facilitator superfamily (MFS) profile domain-containing protein n=1 Tax=Polyplax serrata TaxID=468196 RepID=A0AAN8S0D5_POLSC